MNVQMSHVVTYVSFHWMNKMFHVLLRGFIVILSHFKTFFFFLMEDKMSPTETLLIQEVCWQN